MFHKPKNKIMKLISTRLKTYLISNLSGPTPDMTTDDTTTYNSNLDMIFMVL